MENRNPPPPHTRAVFWLAVAVVILGASNVVTSSIFLLHVFGGHP